jgi:exonuclease VII small subunit
MSLIDNRMAWEMSMRTRHMLAVRELEEAVDWKTRAEARVKEAETKLSKVLEDVMAARPSREPTEEK